MGTIFSKKEKSRITEQDHAILGLKKQRDQLKQYQKRINRDLEKERELAKKLLKEGKKDRAKLLLRKKKFLEGVLDKTDAQLDQLERMVHDIEFATVQKQRSRKILADTQEAVDKQREIDALLSGQLTEEDESAVVEELDKLLMADLEPVIADLPTVPSDKVETIEDQLPEVPTTVWINGFYFKTWLYIQNLHILILQEPKSKTKTPVAVAAS